MKAVSCSCSSFVCNAIVWIQSKVVSHSLQGAANGGWELFFLVQYNISFHTRCKGHQAGGLLMRTFLLMFHFLVHLNYIWYSSYSSRGASNRKLSGEMSPIRHFIFYLFICGIKWEAFCKIIDTFRYVKGSSGNQDFMSHNHLSPKGFFYCKYNFHQTQCHYVHHIFCSTFSLKYFLKGVFATHGQHGPGFAPQTAGRLRDRRAIPPGLRPRPRTRRRRAHPSPCACPCQS